MPKRFTTQMYLYLLPITRSSLPSTFLIPTPDDGIEHTAALFASPQHFLASAKPNPKQQPREKPIILFPPQAYLLTILSKFLVGGGESLEEKPLNLRNERKKLLKFLKTLPTADTERGKKHPTAQVSWADKMICPGGISVRDDGRTVLSLERSGPEVKGTDRKGDWERVVLVRFGKGGPSEVEIRRREDILAEESKEKL